MPHDMAKAPGAAHEALSDAKRLRAVIAGSAGNLIEWYDFYVYAFLALYFAPAFFPEGDRTAQLLNVAGVYAVGFIIRPVGGWFFGRYADRRGRSAALVASVLLMGAGSLLIAVVPTYVVIGSAAPLLLLLARLAQGFSTGGQYAAAAAYLSEVAPPGRRGLYAAFQHVTLMGGQLSALVVLMALQATLPEAEIRAWGWRIPFALGAVLALLVLALRRHMHETTSPESRGESAGSLRALAAHPRAFFTVAALTAGGVATLYTFTTYMQKFLVNSAGLGVRDVSAVMTGAMVIFMVVQPLLGWLSDRIGRRANLLVFSSLMTLAVVPLLTALRDVSGPWPAFGLVLTALLILSFYTSISGLFKAELFPPHVRALGVGVAHSLSAAIFGGTAEFLALWLKQSGREEWFFWYVAALCAVSFLVALTVRPPKHFQVAN